jgi:hypothetical protein
MGFGSKNGDILLEEQTANTSEDGLSHVGTNFTNHSSAHS